MPLSEIFFQRRQRSSTSVSARTFAYSSENALPAAWRGKRAGVAGLDFV
jgi:hypothetical protein